jgi:hypothetical protein
LNLISVQDFGVGISRDMQDKIFGRFFRVSESSGNRVSGLGLGLFISSQIVKQQGGEFWVESEPGKGSQFSFSLPVKDSNRARLFYDKKPCSAPGIRIQTGCAHPSRSVIPALYGMRNFLR